MVGCAPFDNFDFCYIGLPLSGQSMLGGDHRVGLYSHD